MVSHLSDDQIQELLDGNLPVTLRRELNDHTRACSMCRERLSQYQELYGDLAAPPVLTLSKHFARRAARMVGRREIGEVQFGLTQLFFAIAAVIVAFNGLFYFYEWAALVKVFRETGKSMTAFLPSLVASLNPPVAAVDVPTNWAVLAGIVAVLLLLALFDRLVLQPRFRSSS